MGGCPVAGEPPVGLNAARERRRTRGRPVLAHAPVLTYNLMVVGMAESEQADALFHALADPTRRDILAVVLQEAHSVSDLARRYPISFAAVHKHVGALERAGLVTKTRHGREQRVRGDVATLRTAHRLLDDLEVLWRGRMDRIEQLLADPAEEAPQCP
jgi:DNA-binding transcriptional ArsR family regulator